MRAASAAGKNGGGVATVKEKSQFTPAPLRSRRGGSAQQNEPLLGKGKAQLLRALPANRLREIPPFLSAPRGRPEACAAKPRGPLKQKHPPCDHHIAMRDLPHL